MSYSIDALWDQINLSGSRMSRAQLRLWEIIKRVPEEWILGDYGSCWVVGLIGDNAIYYNHHEDGFEFRLGHAMAPCNNTDQHSNRWKTRSKSS